MSEVTDKVHDADDVTDSQGVTDILCSTTGTSWSNAPSSIDLTMTNTFLGETYLPDTLVGFALNGVPIV